MRNLLISLSLTLFPNFLLIGSINAQQIFVPPTPNSAKTRFAPRKPTMREFIIPDIPKFPGATFLSGDEKKGDGQTAAAYSAEYSIPKSAEYQVIPFYANILNSGNWKIAQQTENSIDAANEKTNSHCNIFCDSYDDLTSTLHVYYVMGIPDR